MKKLFVIVGRCQPFHNGQFHMIKQTLNLAETEEAQTLILVGSSNKSRSLKNPFTYLERRKMIVDNLEDIGATDFHVRPLPDFDYQDDRWLNNLHNIIKDFAKENIKEHHFIPIFVSPDRDDDAQLRNSWKSGGGSVITSSYKYKGGNLSATMVRELLVENYTSDVEDDPTLRAVLPFYTRKFLDKDKSGVQALCREHSEMKHFKNLWKDTPYPVIFQATDAFVIDKEDNVLLIERGGAIGKGKYAMAGGYLEEGLTLEENMKKELLEETNLDLDKHNHGILKSWTCDAPDRSGRGRIITTAFMVWLKDDLISDLVDLEAGDDAAHVIHTKLEDIKNGSVDLYSDHAGIINKLCEINNY